MPGPLYNASVHETLILARNDHLRFLSAVAGTEVVAIDDYPLTASFLPFAMPTWRIAGARDLPLDGASQEAIPGIGNRTGGVMGMGQELTVHEAPERDTRVDRTSQVVTDEQKTGRSGPFRLLTVERETVAGPVSVATQREYFALRERA